MHPSFERLIGQKLYYGRVKKDIDKKLAILYGITSIKCKKCSNKDLEFTKATYCMIDSYVKSNLKCCKCSKIQKRYINIEYIKHLLSKCEYVIMI